MEGGFASVVSPYNCNEKLLPYQSHILDLVGSNDYMHARLQKGKPACSTLAKFPPRVEVLTAKQQYL